MLRSRVLLAVLLGLGVVLLFPQVNSPSLDTDGIHYAAVAKEMASSGRFLAPFDPIVNSTYYFHFGFSLWPTAAIFQLLGVCPATAKLYSIGMILVALGGLFLLGRMLVSPWAGWCAGLSFLATNHVLRIARQCRVDLPLIAFIVLAYLFLLLAQKRSRAWYLLAGAASFGAIMTKEVVGLIPFATLVAYLVLRRQWRELLHPALWAGVALAVGPVFGWVFLERALYQTSVWDAYRGQTLFYHLQSYPVSAPWYYYGEVIVRKNGYLLPLALAGVWIAWNKIRRREEPYWLIIFLWALALPIGFTLGRNKAHYYILPMYGAVALLVGLACDRLIRQPWRERVVKGSVALAVLGAVGLACLPIPLHRARYAANVRMAPQIDSVLAGAPGEVIVVRQDVASLVFYADQVRRVRSAHDWPAFGELLAKPAEGRRYCLIGKKDWELVDPEARLRWAVVLDDGERIFVRQETAAGV